jgi:Protein of unknown function (DUF1761)
MNFSNLIPNIQWIPVIVLTIVSFLIGFAWHQPFLFGKTWKLENFQNNMPKINAPLIFGGTAIMHFLAILSLSAVLSGHGGINGLTTGFLISIVWILPAMSGTYLFANRSIKLLVIDSGLYIILFSLFGFILGIW